MAERILSMLFLLLLAAVPASFFAVAGQGASGAPEALNPDSAYENQGLADLESLVRAHLPFALELEQLGLDLRLLGGQREQNGIFISEKGLMRKLDAPIAPNIQRNNESVKLFAERLYAASNGKKNTYLAILPTSVGVMRQNLPQFAEAQLIDQQRLIEEMYNEVSINVRTADVFSSLQNKRDQYIYYRTDSGLTALGGFHVYTAIARRLEISNRSLSQFDIEYVNHAYYGDLYQNPPGTVGGWGNTAPYRKVQPDTISLFRYSGDREYVVTQRSGGEEKVYHTLYPKQRMDLGPHLDVYLGGEAAITDIRSSAPYRNRLLVFGDKTAAAYLPFLANHYQQVTLVNLYYTARSDYTDIRPELYDQVLFAYGIETYIHTNHVAKVDSIQWAD